MAYIRLASNYNYSKLKCLAWASLFLGALIYVLYRPQNILFFRVADYFGLTTYLDHIREGALLVSLPSFVIYSLPAGLWTISYLLLMFATTKFLCRKNRLLISLPLPVTAVVLEFFQLMGWCPGTFDAFDLICYIIPLLVFIKSV